MRKRILFIFAACLLCLATFAQRPIIFINAGSRANYGKVQELFIYGNGQVRYFVREVNGPTRDSLSFNITSQQLDSIFRKANQVNFFNLNARYEENIADGSGILVSMNQNGRIHTVQLFNTDVPGVNELVSFLNSMFVARGIRINYGQFAPKPIRQ